MEAVETLLAIEAIKQLKYRYWRTLDTKQWDEFGECFLPDATADYGHNLVFTGRDAVVDFMRSAMGPGLISMHHGHHPEITVGDGTATGIWYLQDQVYVPEHDFALWGAALYEDRYVRIDDAWFLAHTGYSRTYTSKWKLSDIPSISFTTTDE